MNKKMEKTILIASICVLLLAVAMICLPIFWSNPADPAPPEAPVAPGVPDVTGAPAASPPAPTPASTARITASAASVGGRGYATLQEAVDAARGGAEGSVITLLRDVDLGEASVVAAGGSITLNLNGHAITGTADALIVLKDGAQLIVEDAQTGGGGILNVSDTGCAIFVEDGDLTVNSGAVETLAKGVAAIRSAKGSAVAVNGGSVGGTLTVGGTAETVNEEPAGTPESPSTHTTHLGGIPTCTEAAVCSVCGSAYGMPLGHDFEKWFTVDIAPRCDMAGLKSRHCARCFAVIGSAAIPATGHSFTRLVTSDTEHWYACANPGCTQTSARGAHTGGTATCTEAAVCTVCGAAYIAPLGHNFALEYTVDLAATCTEAGSASRHCTRCGAVTDSEPIAPTGHSVETGWTVTSLGHYHMPACEHTLDAATVSYALHSGGTATCTEAAKCEVCGAYYGLPLEHQFSADWEYDEINHWHACTREGCEETGDSAVHFGGEATCTEAAKCVVCGASYGDPLGHEFETEFTVDREATCAAAGEKSRHCTRCDERKDVTTIPAIPHSYGDWSTTTPPTCVAEGVETRICANCAHTETRAIPVDEDAHRWDWSSHGRTATKPQTCDQIGEWTYVCQNGCGETQTATIPGWEHNHTVTIVQPANGTITVTYADGTPVVSGTSVPCGSVLSVNVTPNAGYHPVGNPAATISGHDWYIPQNKTFTAKYDTATVTAAMAPNTYKITPIVNGVTGAAINVQHGASYTYTITPDAGYGVYMMRVDWSPNATEYSEGGKPVSYTFTDITDNHTIEVTLLPTSDITASVNNTLYGTISPAGATSVFNGLSRTYTITPNEGYAIKHVKVDGVSVGAVETYTFTNVAAPHTIEAVFMARHTITLSVVGGEMGTVSGSTATVNEGEDVTFTATPNEDCTVSIQVDGVLIDKIDDGDGVKNLVYTFANVSAPHEITVSFAVKEVTKYAITAGAGANGTISPCGTIDVPEETDQTFNIAPNTGYKIKDVLVDDASVGAVTSYTFTNITEIHTISATFEQLTYTIAATAGAGGAISPGSTSVAYGGSQTYTVAANANYKIKDVCVDGISVGAVSSYTFSNVTAGHTIEATFEALTASITASAGTGGTISPSGVTNVNQGGEKTYTITPNANYRVADVRVDGVSVGAVTTYTFNNVTVPHTIAATFEPFAYEITAPLAVHGSIGPRVSTFVPHGGSQTYTIVPDTGYTIKDVTVDGVSVGAVPTYTFTNVTAPHTISATFGFAITVSAGEHGTISPATAVVEHGGTVTFTIMPDAGYGLDRTWVDSHSIGASFSYSFTNVTAAHTISAAFEKASYLISIPFTMFGTITPVGSQHAGMGDTVTLQIAPNSGFNLVAGSLTVTDSSGTSYPVSISEDRKTATFTMPAKRVTVNAAFEQTSYTVTVGTTGPGVISLLTTAPYRSPNLITLSIAPQSYIYGIKAGTLKVTGVDSTTYPIVVAADGKTAYFRMPAQNVTVTAEFARLSETIGIWSSAVDTFMKDRDNGTAHMLSAPFGEFVGVMLGDQRPGSYAYYLYDGLPYDPFGQYAGWLEHGQTFFLFKKDYLNSKDPGTYIFTICFSGGTVDLQVTVEKSTSSGGGGFTRAA